MHSLSQLADAFRWWASGGAMVGCVFIAAAFAAVNRFPPANGQSGYRLMLSLLTICAFALAAILMAGAMIPWASDGRLSWFTRDTVLYEVIITLAWLLWGLFAWGLSLWFTRDRRKMALACGAWLTVCIVAAYETVGIAL